MANQKSNSETEMRLKGEITPKTRIPLGIVVWLMGIAFAGAMAWADLHYEIKEIGKNAVTESQQREWIDSFRENNPTTKVPHLPDKRTDAVSAIGILSINEIQP